MESRPRLSYSYPSSVRCCWFACKIINITFFRNKNLYIKLISIIKIETSCALIKIHGLKKQKKIKILLYFVYSYPVWLKSSVENYINFLFGRKENEKEKKRKELKGNGKQQRYHFAWEAGSGGELGECHGVFRFLLFPRALFLRQPHHHRRWRRRRRRGQWSPSHLQQQHHHRSHSL